LISRNKEQRDSTHGKYNQGEVTVQKSNVFKNQIGNNQNQKGDNQNYFRQKNEQTTLQIRHKIPYF